LLIDLLRASHESVAGTQASSRASGRRQGATAKTAAPPATAGKAGDDGTQKAELQNAMAILTEYINYVKGAPLVAHIDQNPFGVKTGLEALLAAGLTKAAKVI
jgi:hypothetical protein